MRRSPEPSRLCAELQQANQLSAERVWWGGDKSGYRIEGVGGKSGDWVIGGGIRRKRSEGRGDSRKLNNGHDSQEVTQRQKREVSEKKMNVRQRC